MDRLLQQLQSLHHDTANQDKWSRTFAEKHYSHIVQEQVESLLVMDTTNDIPKVRGILNKIKKDGIAGIWDLIKNEVKRIAQIKSDTVFTDEQIETGKTIVIDVDELHILFVAQMVALADKMEKNDATKEELISLVDIITAEYLSPNFDEAAMNITDPSRFLSQTNPNAASASSSPASHHEILVAALQPYEMESTQAVFKSIHDRNYNQALRRICTVNSTVAHQMLSILLTFKDSLSINLDEQAGPKQQSALHVTATHQNQPCYDLLMNAGANISLKDKQGNTATHYLEEAQTDELEISSICKI